MKNFILGFTLVFEISVLHFKKNQKALKIYLRHQKIFLMSKYGQKIDFRWLVYA